MRILIIALALLGALPARADPDLAGMARRLASDDPQVRAFAREEGLALPESRAPELEALADRVEDAEARAALREIAEVLRDRVLRREAKKILRKGLPVESLAREAGNEALPALLRIFEHPEDFDKHLDYCGNEIIAQQASQLLAELTLAEEPQWEGGWREFLESQRGKTLDDIRTHMLEKQGFRVCAADVEERAGQLAAARGWVDAMGSPGHSCTMAEYLAPRIDARLQSLGVRDGWELQEWIAANRGFLFDLGGKIVSRATSEHFSELLAGNSRLAIRGALRALSATPQEIPDSAWEHLGRHADLVLPLMALAEKPVPEELVGRLLTIAEGRWGDRGIARLWNEEQLVRWLRASDRSDPRRAVALEILTGLGGERGLEAVAEATRDFRSGDARGKGSVAEAALEILSRATELSQLDGIAAWARDAEPSHERRQVVFALFKKGHRAGLEMAVALAAQQKIVPVECAWVREQADGAPEGYGREEWASWAALGSARYEWQESEKRWRRKE